MTSQTGCLQNQVLAECSYFGTCGGCVYRDLPYAEQLARKQMMIEEKLAVLKERHGFTASPILPSPKPDQYRHMISLTIKRRHGKLRAGFIGWEETGQEGQRRRIFLPIESCFIADERLNAFLPAALEMLEALPPKKRFRTSQIVLRVGDCDEVVTSLRADRNRTLQCTIQDKVFSYSMSSFFQNNFSILDSFAGTVRSFLSPTGKETLYDLYCGVGFFSLLLADSYERVCGIEEGYEAIQHARQSAERNGVSNATFLEGKVEALFSQNAGFATGPIHVVVDPPRVGLKPEVIACLNALPVERLVYISCETDALERDLKLLESRFLIRKVQPLDLFPQTKHVETVVLMEPR